MNDDQKGARVCFRLFSETLPPDEIAESSGAEWSTWRTAISVWINGPFGGGKTSTARALQGRIPGSVLFDPESLGIALRDGMRPPLRGDFQPLPLWRSLAHRVIGDIAAASERLLIVPMTVVVHAYFDETVGALRRD